MSTEKSQQVVVVTGAAKGLGYETTKQLAKQGYTVVLTARNQQAGLDAQAKLADEGLEVDFLALDITEPESVTAFVSTLTSRYGRCDVLVNNAAIFYDWESTASTVDLVEVQAILTTNVVGSMRITQALMPLLQSAPQGKVVNVSSDLGSLSYAADPDHEFYSINGVAYRISKAAFNMFALSLGKECEQSNITVTVVSPGWCQTDMGTDAAPRTATQGAQSIAAVVSAPNKQYHNQFILDGQIVSW